MKFKYNLFILTLIVSNYCAAFSPNLESWENLFKEHEKAFKELEPYAKDIKVKITHETHGNVDIENVYHTYPSSEAIFALMTYETVYKKLCNRIYTNAWLKGIGLGFLTAILKTALTKYKNGNLGKQGPFDADILIATGLASIAIIGHENMTNPKIAYFYPDVVVKQSNIFSDPVENIGRTFTLFGLAELSYFLASFSIFIIDQKLK